MVRYSMYATALLAALVAGTAYGQPGGGGRGNRGGFGGPGGGFGGRGSATMLLSVPEVQKELSVTDDQKKQIEDLRTEARQQFQNGAGGNNGGTRPNFRDMTQEERDKAMADMRSRFEKAAKATDEKLAKILSADQMTRLKQLELQSQGASALTTPDVVTKLKLTDDQQTKIKKIVDDARSQQRGQGRQGRQRGQGGQGGQAGQTDEQRQAAAAQRREQRSKTLKDALAVLDDDQLVQWGEMSGKEFKFPDNMGFGNRGNRGGRGRNRGNGGGNQGGGTPTPQST